MSTRRWAAGGLRIFVACVAFAASAADSVDPQRLSEARAVVKAMELDKQLDQMVGVMGQELTKALVRAGGIAGQNPRVAQIVVGESMAMSRDNAVKPGGLIDTVAQVYAEKFSLDELRQGGRTVGVISYVEAMKEQLPAQLTVTASPHGPSTIAQHAGARV